MANVPPERSYDASPGDPPPPLSWTTTTVFSSFAARERERERLPASHINFPQSACKSRGLVCVFLFVGKRGGFRPLGADERGWGGVACHPEGAKAPPPFQARARLAHCPSTRKQRKGQPSPSAPSTCAPAPSPCPCPHWSVYPASGSPSASSPRERALQCPPESRLRCLESARSACGQRSGTAFGGLLSWCPRRNSGRVGVVCAQCHTGACRGTGF